MHHNHHHHHGAAAPSLPAPQLGVFLAGLAPLGRLVTANVGASTGEAEDVFINGVGFFDPSGAALLTPGGGDSVVLAGTPQALRLDRPRGQCPPVP